jgi:hypothetical protein
MRVTALVLGILGGIGGILGALSALKGPLVAAGFSGQSNVTTGIALIAVFSFIFCVAGFAGAGFALAKPRLAALLLLIAAIGLILSVCFRHLCHTLFLLAALFAFLGRRPKKKAGADDVGATPVASQ